MINILKKLLGLNIPEEPTPDLPGRTFKKILCGKYFGSEDISTDKVAITEAKKNKVAQIKELELIPKFARYMFRQDDTEREQPIGVHVAFQKEVTPDNWNMIHITEIAFIVNFEDLKEFEKMAKVNIDSDFKHLEPYGNNYTYAGKERRKETRNVQMIA